MTPRLGRGWAPASQAWLTLVFDRPLPDGTSIEVADHASTALEWTSEEFDGTQVRLRLANDSADRLSEGGRLQVRLDGDDSQVSQSWPDHLAHLRGRLDKAVSGTGYTAWATSLSRTQS